MPQPLIWQRTFRIKLAALIEATCQSTPVEQRNEMPLIAAGGRNVPSWTPAPGLHPDSTAAPSSRCATGVNSVSGCFLESDNSAGHVPAGAVKSVAPPGQQSSTTIVLDKQVDVDERGNPADEEKQFLGQASRPRVDVALDLADQRRQFARRISQS